MAQFFTRQQTLSNLIINSNLSIMKNGAIKLFDANSANSITLQSPSNMFSNITITLPNKYGNSGDFIRTDETGRLRWYGVKSNSGEILYNNEGEFTGLQNLTYNPNTNILEYRNGMDIRLNNMLNTNSITVGVPQQLTSSYRLLLPSNIGIANNVLTTDGNNSLYWSNIIANTRSNELLYNSNGIIASIAGFGLDGNNLNIAGNMKIRFGGDNNMCIFCPNVETMQLNSNENIHMNAQKVANFITGNNSNGFIARSTGFNSNIVLETSGFISNIDIISKNANVNILTTRNINMGCNCIYYKNQILEIGNHITSRVSATPTQITFTAPYVLFKALETVQRDKYYCIINMTNAIIDGQTLTFMFDNSLKSGVELHISFPSNIVNSLSLANNLVGLANRDKIIFNRNGQSISLIFIDGSFKVISTNLL